MQHDDSLSLEYAEKIMRLINEFYISGDVQKTAAIQCLLNEMLSRVSNHD